MNTELEILENNSSIESLNRSEIDMQISTARKYPRQLSQVRDKVLTLATMDDETARACFFSLPTGGKTISGESVRLAEILVSCYGNIRAAWRPISIDRKNGVVTCQGVCHDLESNASTSLEKSRQVQKKRGATTYDEHMITLATNACGAIAYRDAVFKVVPKALIKPILGRIKEAARGKGTLDQKVDGVIKRLIQIAEESGEKGKDLEKRILSVVGASKREDIDLARLDTLIGLGTAIADGEARFADLFKQEQKTPDLPGRETKENDEGEGE